MINRCIYSFAYILLPLLLLACSEKEGTASAPTDSKVIIEARYTPKSTSAAIIGAEIQWPINEEEGQSAIVKNDAEWNRTIVYDCLPEYPVGLNISTILNEVIANGTVVDVNYDIECTVSLVQGDKVIDFMAIEDAINYDFTYTETEPYDLTERYLFSIVHNRIERLSVYPEDDSEEETEIPENDTDEIKAQGTLYYFSQANEEENKDHLFDNFIARFSDRRLWNGSELTAGDFLFLYKNDIEKISLEALRASLSNGLVLVVDALESYDVFKRFCDANGIYNPLTDEDIDVSHTMFIISFSEKSINNNQAMPYRGVFFMLSPQSCIPGKPMSDYWQGEIINQAISKLNEVHNPVSHDSAVARGGMDDDMQRLVGAYKVFIANKGRSQSLEDFLYQDKNKASEYNTNIYNSEYDIWNVYSIAEKRNYYYIHQEFLGSFAGCYKDIYSCNVITNNFSTIAKVCEWYGDFVKLTTTPDTPGMQIHRNSPATTQSSTGYESGFSWNLGGEIGFLGSSPSGNISNGISLSSSQTYTVNDVTVYNTCEPGTKLEWTFDFAKPRCKFHPFKKAGTTMIEGALVGRKSFTAGTDFIISFPESDKAPVITGSIYVQLRSTCGKAGIKCHEDTKYVSTWKTISLPYLKHSQFNK